MSAYRACLAAVLFGVAALGAAPAQAQVKLEARYTVTLAGIPLGSGSWVIDLAPDQYTAVSTGRTTGLVKMFSDGSGTTGVRGVFQNAQPVPVGYVSTIVSEKRSDEVRMVLNAGTVREVVVDPPVVPSPDRIPVTEANRKGVIDPMSAVLVTVPGTGDVVTPDACKRRLPVFDGRQRADIELQFKRIDRVRADKGYEGPVVVCTLLYHPIAGHRPDRSAIKFLVAQRDMELWLAPIAGTRMLVPFRFSVPTPFGTGVLQANYFVVSPRQTARDTPVTAKAQ